MSTAPTTIPIKNQFLFFRRLAIVSFSITISSSVTVSCQSDRVSYESEPYLLVISHYTYYSRLYVFCNPPPECLLFACFAIQYIPYALPSMRLPEAWFDKRVWWFVEISTGFSLNIFVFQISCVLRGLDFTYSTEHKARLRVSY